MTEDNGSTSWEQWPRQCGARAQEVVSLVERGAPEQALELVDGMIADLDSRRGMLAELANDLD